MIQANLLITTTGKTADSFVVLDIMRLPPGILTGVGFIGAGAIFRRNDLLLGGDNSATLWFVTVIGLCLVGGQIALGIAGTAISLLVLWGLKALELRLPQERTAFLTLKMARDAPIADGVGDRLHQSGLQITKIRESYANDGDGSRTMRFNLRWDGLREDPSVPAVVAELARTDGMKELEWNS